MQFIIERLQTVDHSKIVELEVLMTLKNRETTNAMRKVLRNKEIKDL